MKLKHVTIMRTVTVALVMSASLAVGGETGVVDLDRVATAMGWMEEISQSLQDTNTELKSQLEEVHSGMLKSIEAVKQQIATEAKLNDEQVKILNTAKDQKELDGLPLTQEQKTKLVTAVNEANVKWQRALNTYQQALQSRRTTLVQSYRERIRPSVRRVASSRGKTVVLSVSDNLIYNDAQDSDITDQVIDELQKTMPGKGAETKPAAPSPDAAKPTK